VIQRPGAVLSGRTALAGRRQVAVRAAGPPGGLAPGPEASDTDGCRWLVDRVDSG